MSRPIKRGPALVWIDPRIADRLPVTEESAAEQLAGPDTQPIPYLRADIAEQRIRDASQLDAEIIITIQTVGDIIHGLSNHGRLWAFGVVEGARESWHLIADRELNS